MLLHNKLNALAEMFLDGDMQRLLSTAVSVGEAAQHRLEAINNPQEHYLLPIRTLPSPLNTIAPTPTLGCLIVTSVMVKLKKL